MWLSRCLTFRQPPSQDGTSFDWFVFVMSHVVVKVSHLSAAPQSRWHIFRLVRVRHVTCGCQGVSPFGSPQSLMPMMCHLEAVHRFYESRRRLFNDDRPSRRQKAGEVKKKCKKIVQQKKVKVHAYSIMIFCILYYLIERRF